jgi:hypothetical protein
MSVDPTFICYASCNPFRKGGTKNDLFDIPCGDLELMGPSRNVLRKLGIAHDCTPAQAAVSFVLVVNKHLPGALQRFCGWQAGAGLLTAMTGDGGSFLIIRRKHPCYYKMTSRLVWGGCNVCVLTL